MEIRPSEQNCENEKFLVPARKSTVQLKNMLSMPVNRYVKIRKIAFLNVPAKTTSAPNQIVFWFFVFYI